MDQTISNHFNNFIGKDPDQWDHSFQYIIELTQEPVNWAYDIWDEVLAMLKSKDNHVRQ